MNADAEAYRQRMREKRDGKPPGRPKPATRQGDRFAPLNALVDGGHLAKLTPRELKVWIALYRHAKPDGTVTVSGTRLGELAGIEREHASRTTKRLERRGYIECVTRGRTLGERGERTANVFRILTPPLNSASGGTIQGHE